jgi:lysophospholipase L1-like esterase
MGTWSNKKNKLLKVLYILIVVAELMILINIIHSNTRLKKVVLGLQSKNNTNVIQNIKYTSFDIEKMLKNYYIYEPIPNTQFRNLMMNMDGLNSPKNYEVSKSEGVYRIAAIGDSHTFGVYVKPNDNYPSSLEKYLNSKYCSNSNCYEVINFGVPGFDPLFITYRYKVKAKKYNPDLIIWYIKNDDFTEIKSLMDSYAKICAEKNLNSENTPLSSDLQSIVNTGADYCWLWSWNLLYTNYGENNVDNININIIDAFATELNNKKILFFIYKNELPKYKNLLFQLKARHKNVYIYDGLNYEDLPRFEDEHPNEDGYEIIAEHLSKYIIKEFVNKTN